ncbi:MAG TPA: AI-2E family transporter [Bdellovibrionales bacterium]|nr:AI-2E family transporter [Bdellovibrionales bacterium]
MIFRSVNKTKSSQKTVFALAFILGFLYITGPFLVSVSLGAVIAIVSAPLMVFLVNRGWRKRVAAFTVTAGLTLAVVIPTTWLLIVGSQTAFTQLKGMRLSDEGSLSQLAYTPKFTKAVSSLTRTLNLPEGAILQGARRALHDVTSFFAELFGDIVYQLPEIAVGVLALILAIYYFLADGHRVVGFLRTNSPYPQESTEKIENAIKDASFSVIVATFLSAISQTILMTGGVWVTGTPNAALIGLFTFLFAFLPIIGTAPISLGVTIYHFALGNSSAGLVMLGVALAVSLVDNVVHLFVLKNRSHIHPLIGFVAVFGGLKVLGFGGIFLGPVLAAITLELIPILIRDQKREPPTTTLEVAPHDIQVRRGPA